MKKHVINLTTIIAILTLLAGSSFSTSAHAGLFKNIRSLANQSNDCSSYNKKIASKKNRCIKIRVRNCWGTKYNAIPVLQNRYITKSNLLN